MKLVNVGGEIQWYNDVRSVFVHLERRHDDDDDDGRDGRLL